LCLPIVGMFVLGRAGPSQVKFAVGLEVGVALGSLEISPGKAYHAL